MKATLLVDLPGSELFQFKKGDEGTLVKTNSLPGSHPAGYPYFFVIQHPTEGRQVTLVKQNEFRIEVVE